MDIGLSKNSCQEWWWGVVLQSHLFLFKICCIYSTMMKLCTVILYLKKIQKNYKSPDTPLSSADISIFHQLATLLYPEVLIKIVFRKYFLLLLLTFIEPLKVVLINMIKILMMSSKSDAVGLLKIKAFWKIGYDVKIFVYDVTQKVYLMTQIIF